MAKTLVCAVCGKRVNRDNGFFRSFPTPVALHHGCKEPPRPQPEPKTWAEAELERQEERGIR